MNYVRLDVKTKEQSTNIEHTVIISKHSSNSYLSHEESKDVLTKNIPLKCEEKMKYIIHTTRFISSAFTKIP